MSKKKKKSTKEQRPDTVSDDWAVSWCRDNVEQLSRYRGTVVTIEKTHGIVNVALTLSDALYAAEFLKKSIKKGAFHVDVSVMLAKLGHSGPGLVVERDDYRLPRNKRESVQKKWVNPPKKPSGPPDPIPQLDDDLFPSFGPAQPPTRKTGPLDIEDQGSVPERIDPPPPLDPPVDLFDGDANPDEATVTDEKPDETLSQVAGRLCKKSTEVLMKVLAWPEDNRPDPCHLNSRLTPEQVKRIESEFSPFPSPHEQPPFMPRQSPLDQVRLDGVANPMAPSWSRRNIRYD